MSSLHDLYQQMGNAMRDPISLELISPNDAVVTPYGHTFAESSIREWVATNRKCPITQQPLTLKELKPNFALREVLQVYNKMRRFVNASSSNNISSSTSISSSSLDGSSLVVFNDQTVKQFISSDFNPFTLPITDSNSVIQTLKLNHTQFIILMCKIVRRIHVISLFEDRKLSLIDQFHAVESEIEALEKQNKSLLNPWTFAHSRSQAWFKSIPLTLESFEHKFFRRVRMKNGEIKPINPQDIEQFLIPAPSSSSLNTVNSHPHNVSGTQTSFIRLPNASYPIYDCPSTLTGSDKDILSTVFKALNGISTKFYKFLQTSQPQSFEAQKQIALETPTIGECLVILQSQIQKLIDYEKALDDAQDAIWVSLTSLEEESHKKSQLKNIFQLNKHKNYNKMKSSHAKITQSKLLIAEAHSLLDDHRENFFQATQHLERSENQVSVGISNLNPHLDLLNNQIDQINFAIADTSTSLQGPAEAAFSCLLSLYSNLSASKFLSAATFLSQSTPYPNPLASELSESNSFESLPTESLVLESLANSSGFTTPIENEDENDDSKSTEATQDAQDTQDTQDTQDVQDTETTVSPLSHESPIPISDSNKSSQLFVPSQLEQRQYFYFAPLKLPKIKTLYQSGVYLWYALNQHNINNQKAPLSFDNFIHSLNEAAMASMYPKWLSLANTLCPPKYFDSALRLAQSDFLRFEGNAAFKQKKYTLAKDLYSQACSALSAKCNPEIDSDSILFVPSLLLNKAALENSIGNPDNSLKILDVFISRAKKGISEPPSLKITNQPVFIPNSDRSSSEQLFTYLVSALDIDYIVSASLEPITPQILSKAHRRRAETLLSQGKTGQALQAVNAALDINPKDPAAKKLFKKIERAA